MLFSAAGTFLAGMVAFGSTSLDSLLVLLPARVALGYLAAMVLVVSLSWGAGWAGETLLPMDPGVLGVVPLGLGLWMLVASLRARGDSGPSAPGVRSGLGMFAVTLSISGDNLAVFAPLFADLRGGLEIWFAGGIAGGILIWLRLSRWLAGHPRWRGWLLRWGPRVLPFILMGVGLYILSDSPTDALGVVGESEAG